MNELTLSPAEILRVAGGYKRPGDQLRELHRQGFYRARLGRVSGEVILERPHYDAVCAAAGQAHAAVPSGRPKLRAAT